VFHEVSRTDHINLTLASTPTSARSSISKEGSSQEAKVCHLIPKVRHFFGVNTARPDALNRKIRVGRVDGDPKQIYFIIYQLTQAKKWQRIEQVPGSNVKVYGKLTAESTTAENGTLLSSLDTDAQDQILGNLRGCSSSASSQPAQEGKAKSHWSVLPHTMLEVTTDQVAHEKSSRFVTLEINLVLQKG